MSKNYHNYSKPYKTPDVEERVVPASTSPAVETVEEEIVPAVEEVVEETVGETVGETVEETLEEPTVEAAPELPKTVTGIVSGCKSLNVRNRPNITAGILTAIPEGTEVAISQPVVDGDFYKVTLANGIVGYSMKKFIAVK